MPVERPATEAVGGITRFYLPEASSHITLTIANNPLNEIEIKSKEKMLSMKDGQFPIRKISALGSLLIVSADPKYFNIWEKPQKSGSQRQGSKVTYGGISVDEKYRIQITPPWVDSSLHHHEGPEIYRRLSGRQIVKKGDDYEMLSAENPTVYVSPFTRHRVQTLNEPCFAFLVCDFEHHYYK